MNTMSRRNIELILMGVATVLLVALFAMLAVTQGESLGMLLPAIAGGVIAAFAVAHVALRKFVPNADPALLPIAYALCGVGIAFVMRVAPELIVKQTAWLGLGIACMIAVVALVKNIDQIAKYKYTCMIAGFVLLLSPLLPFVGQEIYGSRIWLSIGPLSFQPGEIAKIVVVLFLAAYLAANREMLSVFTWRVGPVRLPDIRTLLPLLFMWIIAMLIVVFEKDLGSALVFFCIFLAMLYVASGKKTYLVIGILLATIAAVALYLLFGHVQDRVNIWLDPFSDAQGAGYQLVQATYSIADGGLFGVGIGSGLCTLIPVVESDFIFAAIAEETGLLGAAGILMLYLCFAVRGFVVAARAKSDVSSFICAGLTVSIVVQAFIIAGGVTRLIPLTGLTLPFVSQGGSSLLSSFIALGLLLHCGNNATGIDTEIKASPSTTSINGVLGRTALGNRLTVSMIICSVMFAALVANLTWIMVVQASEIQSKPENNHTLLHETQTQRGTISTYDGTVLAQSTLQDDGSYERQYPAGDLASHVVGYASTRYGTTGIESTCNDLLSGKSGTLTWEDVFSSLTRKHDAGSDVTLTLNSAIQKSAQEQLAGESGACIVMDATTGATLALASAPTYQISGVEALLEAASSGTSTDSALFNRATQALYAPGSTFKIVSLSAALQTGVADESTIFSAPGTMLIGGRAVTNFDSIDYGNITLKRATELSSNTAFGQLGVKIGAENLVAVSNQFLFDRTIPYDLSTSVSLMPDPAQMTEWELAWAAAGEPVGEHSSPAGPQASVLNMALVGCAIANDGVIQKPYLVDSVRNVLGQRTYTATPEVLTTALDADTADRVGTVLQGVVQSGTGTAAQIPGVTVAGKTGTAERGDGYDDSWFVGYAEVGNSKIVVAIVVEKSDGTATAKARNVLMTALQVQGLL